MPEIQLAKERQCHHIILAKLVFMLNKSLISQLAKNNQKLYHNQQKNTLLVGVYYQGRIKADKNTAYDITHNTFAIRS